jgi:2'-5' RNA ligase
MKRLFAALKIHPDQDFLLFYKKIRTALQHEPIKWVEENNIHITIKFFGETDERKIPGISQALRNRAAHTAQVALAFSKTGIFGSSYAPKVIWLGIEPYLQLTKLMMEVQKDLEPLGYQTDRQNMVPHLTLGRIKFLRDRILFQNTIQKFQEFSTQQYLIGEMILYESILHREGPEYKIVERFPFKK